MGTVGEANVDGGLKEGVASTIGSEVRDGMFHAVSGWLEKQGNPDVRRERMAMWQRINAALPSGKLKDWHGKSQWLAEIDAKVAGWSGGGKDVLWKAAKGVIAAEFPPALFLPDNTPSILDAWSARLGGIAGEALIKGGVNVKQRMDQALLSILSGAAMRPIVQGAKV